MSVLTVFNADVNKEAGVMKPTKTLIIDEREGKNSTRSIPFTSIKGVKQLALNYAINSPLFGERYKTSQVTNKAQKTALFSISGLILPGDTKGKHPVNVDIPENKIYRFVYIGYQLEQNPKTRKSAYGLKLWTIKKKYNKLDYYGCVYLLVSNDLLVNRRQGFGGKSRYEPKKTMHILLERK